MSWLVQDNPGLTCCSRIVINSIDFYSQRHPGLGGSLHVHLTHSILYCPKHNFPLNQLQMFKSVLSAQLYFVEE
jgi:hypothetical protein